MILDTDIGYKMAIVSEESADQKNDHCLYFNTGHYRK
jgi:hypothetical protein